jgi:hypothetical protein
MDIQAIGRRDHNSAVLDHRYLAIIRESPIWGAVLVDILIGRTYDGRIWRDESGLDKRIK